LGVLDKPGVVGFGLVKNNEHRPVIKDSFGELELLSIVIPGLFLVLIIGDWPHVGRLPGQNIDHLRVIGYNRPTHFIVIDSCHCGRPSHPPGSIAQVR